ncbi:Aconitate hydratase [Dirofilaria immitis]
MSVFVPPTLITDQEEGRLSRMLRRPAKQKYSTVRINSIVSTGVIRKFKDLFVSIKINSNTYQAQIPRCTYINEMDEYASCT